MSTTPKNDTTTTEPTSPITEADDVRLFQAVRRTGRRNAIGDLSEQLVQVNASNASSDVDSIAPRLKSMSIQQ